MPYEVRLKRGFPSDSFRRSGLVFSAQPRVITDEEMTEAIRKEPAFKIKKMKAEPESEVDKVEDKVKVEPDPNPESETEVKTGKGKNKGRKAANSRGKKGKK